MRPVIRHLVEQFVDTGIDDHDRGMGGTDEAGVDHPAVEGDQVVIETRRIEQPHRLAVIAELRPADRFPQLVHRADAAGDGQETVGQVREQALALVHPRYDMQLGQVPVRGFGFDERVGNHADHFAARRQRAVGDGAHQSQAPAAIDDADPARGQGAADMARGLDIDGIGGSRGPAIDGKALHRSNAFKSRPLCRKSGVPASASPAI